MILYDDLSINENNLKIPHPRWEKRDFVILPMLDLYRDNIFKKERIEKLLKNLKERYILRIFSKKKLDY